MKRNGLIAVVCTVLVLVCVGCKTQGHRKWEFTALGSTVSFEDQAFQNSKGEDIHITGFDPESNVVARLLNWLDPPAKTEPETAAEPTDGDD